MPNQVIAISGPPGSGSTTVGKILSQKLNCNYFSPGRLWKDIASGKLKEQYYSNLFLESCNKRNLQIPEIRNKDDSRGALNLWNTSFGKNPKLHEAIDELQINLAEKGRIVFDGKLSLHMIRSAKPKIWLFASLEERARRAARRDKFPEDQAIDIIQRRQETERAEWQNIYGFDYWMQKNVADIVIDTTNKKPEEVAEEILDIISKDNF